ncbi:IS3 family transposase [Pseudomonas sp. BEA3.1]|uniref:IS3 family transposase n=1 Tax=Pseudomonas sp. BEA3.1 TaxID=3083251 RepID=UPI0029647AC6|nr:IS3 family transposase [Pseudomonas sp. BEA3.1]MDW2777940.1 IS3 family transposase [Pseudomonas sp. BEA3.1]
MLGVKRSSFYAWRKRQGRENPARDALRLLVIKHFNASRGASGSRTLMQELRHEGHEVGRYKVRALMREAGLKCKQRKPRCEERREKAHACHLRGNELSQG